MRTANPAAGGARLSGRDRELRLLEYAIAASVALHVLALLGLQGMTPAPTPSTAVPESISARLVESPPSPLPVTVPEPSPPVATEALSPAPAPDGEPAPVPEPAPRAAAAKRSLRPGVEKRVPQPEVEKRATQREAVAKSAPQAAPRPRAGPKREPRIEGRPAEADPAVAPPPRASPPSAPATATTSAAAAPAPAPSAPVDADVLSRYRLQLIGAARRYKRYPRAAIDNQWEGAAEVAMVVDANGRIRDMTISASSGHEVLDRQAIDMFRKAKPLVPIPPALRGREFRVMLKAIYSLRDPGA